MSTLKVNKIEATGTTDGGIEIDSDGHVQLDGVQLPTSGQLSNRNFIINGDMRVAQRSTSAVNVGSATSRPAYHTLDRWSSWSSNADKFSCQQVADGPPSFNYSIKITSLTALSLGGGSYFALGQRIEAQNLYSSDIGTSDAKDLILSFWVKSSIAGTYSVYAFNDDWQWSFVQNYTIQSADTWEYKTISIPGATSADFNVSANATQLEVGFSFGAGTNWSTSQLGSWLESAFKIHSSTASDLLTTDGATMNITGVQLEVGDKATPFEHRSYGDELARCRRYYQVHPDNSDIYIPDWAGYPRLIWPVSPPMRGDVDIEYPLDGSSNWSMTAYANGIFGYNSSQNTARTFPGVKLESEL